MAIRSIRTAGDPVLRQRTQLVEDFGSDLRCLVTDMFETMYVAEGVGLAANQIGVGLRVFVYDCPNATGVWQAGVVVNPQLTSDQEAVGDVADEGCLSVPGQRHPLERATRATVTGFGLDGQPVEVDGTGVLARCFQHEVDHLNGHLYLDWLADEHAHAAGVLLDADPTAGHSWLPELPDGVLGPINRDMPMPSGNTRGPLITADPQSQQAGSRE
jgi:peptide deformylase